MIGTVILLKTNLIIVLLALFLIHLTNYQVCPEMRNARQAVLQGVTGFLGLCFVFRLQVVREWHRPCL